MKLSYLAAGTLILSTVACGRFGEVTLDVQTLDIDKEVSLLRNGAEFPAIIQNIEFEFEKGLLTGDKQESEIFDAVTIDFDLGDELKNEIDAGDLVIKADKLYNDFEFNLVAIRYELEADLNNNGQAETVITVEIEDINELFQFENLGVNSFKQNLEMILQFDPKGILDTADIQQLVVNQVVNVNSVLLDQVLDINVDVAPDEIDIALDNIVDPAKALVAFVYNVKAQQERVKP